MNIIRKKGTKLDGNAPALLTGYGGYGISRAARGSASRTASGWSRAASSPTPTCAAAASMARTGTAPATSTNKQNVFDDFVACAQTLVDERSTRAPTSWPSRAAGTAGCSMGAELTQHPDAFRAVVSHVGIYDMLRVELTPNGAFNVTEFGTVKDPDAVPRALCVFAAITTSRTARKYPAVLFLTGANDPRVDPCHSRKMTARLQAATTSGLPVLLRTSGNTGHGMGTPLDERVEQAADVHAFLVEQLGMAVP